jgi:hypothetical protein
MRYRRADSHPRADDVRRRTPSQGLRLAGEKGQKANGYSSRASELSDWCKQFDLPIADRLFEKRSAEIILASAVERLLRSLLGSAVVGDTESVEGCILMLQSIADELVILPERSHLFAHIPGEFRAGFLARQRRVGRFRCLELISLSPGPVPDCGPLADGWPKHNCSSHAIMHGTESVKRKVLCRT